MKWLDRLDALSGNQKGPRDELTKLTEIPREPSKPIFVSSVSTGPGPFEILERPDPFDSPAAGHAPEWRRWFNLMVQHKEELGHPPPWLPAWPTVRL
jgi:hypothetical protein